jgi:SAM-dependent methyltransferase
MIEVIQSEVQEEWTKLGSAELAYHLSQWKQPKRATQAFADFLRPVLSSTSNVVDVGCGAGAATYFLAKQNQQTQFCGIDISAELITFAKNAALEMGSSNLDFQIGNWLELEAVSHVDGVISIQTLSWLPDFERPLQEIFQKIKPNWLGLTSLFYAGEISCKIEVTQHAKNKHSFYNIYAIPEIAGL